MSDDDEEVRSERNWTFFAKNRIKYINAALVPVAVTTNFQKLLNKTFNVSSFKVKASNSCNENGSHFEKYTVKKGQMFL